MAYPIIKSAWDNFSESYMQAREARAREERAKELSMREFDQNQRLWNQEQRSADKYINYEKQLNAYGLDDKRMANELGIAGHGGNMAEAGLKTDVRRQLYTPENVTQEVSRVNADRNLMAKMALAKNGLPDNVINSAATRNLYIGAGQGAGAEQDYLWMLSPEYLKNQQTARATQSAQINAMSQQMQDDINAANTARVIAARPASTFSDRYTPSTNGATFGAPAMPAATTAPQAKATPAAVKPAAPVAQSPMAGMTAKQPTADVRKQPTVGEAYDFAKTNRQSIEQRLSLIGLAERAKNPVAYQALINSLNQAKINEAMAQDAWLNSPEAISAQRVFGR
jgi:hypothetical protein